MHIIKSVSGLYFGFKKRVTTSLDVLSTALYFFVLLSTGAITNILIVFFLDATQQGYWYSFASLLTLAGFAELGAGQVLTRLTAVECGQKAIDGERAQKRIRALFRIALALSFLAPLVAIMIGFTFGLWWLTLSTSRGEWLPAWILAVLAAASQLGVSFINSYGEGLLEVAKVNFGRSFSQFISFLVLIVSLYEGLGLYSLALSRFAFTFAALSYLAWNFWKRFLSERLWQASNHALSWRLEFWPLQWRYALTWLTGVVFNFSLVPIVLRYDSVEAAGKLGLSISLGKMITALAYSWIVSRRALLSSLVGAENYSLFKVQIRKIIRNCLLTYSSIGGTAVAVMFINPAILEKITSRMLSPSDFTILILGGFASLVIVYTSEIVRAFQKEPFAKISWTHAIVTLVAAFPATMYFGVTGAVVNWALFNAIFAIVYRRVMQKYLKRINRIEESDRS